MNRSKSFKPHHDIPILTVFLIVFALALFVITTSSGYSELQQSCVERLSDSTKNTAKHINYIFNENYKHLSCLAGLVSELESKDPESIMALLGGFNDYSGINRFRVVLPDGSIVTQDGILKDPIDFVEASTGGPHFSPVTTSVQYGDSIIRQYIPVFDGDKPVAVVYIVYPITDLSRELASPAYQGRLFISIIDRRTGENLVDTHSVKYFNNLNDYADLYTNDGLPTNNLIADIKNGVSGYAEINSLTTGEANYVSFVPSSFSEFEVMTIISTDIALADAISYKTLANWFTILAVLVFLFYGAYIMFRSNHEISAAVSKESVRLERESKRRLEEQYAFLDGLSREYHTIWLVLAHDHSLKLFRSAFEHSSCPSAVQMALDYANYDVVMKKYIENYVLDDDRKRLRAVTRFDYLKSEVPESGLYSLTYKSRNDEGFVSYQQMCFAKAEGTNGDINYIVAFRDVDEAMHAEIKKQQLLEDALKSAESANKSKNTFLFNMSHDIRTPMNAISGYTSMARKYLSNPEKAEDCLNKIDIAGQHLLRLINDILDMSRIETGHVQINLAPVDILDHINSVLTICTTSASERGISIKADYSNVTASKVYADELRIDQIMMNILSNAIKYSNPGGTVNVTVLQLDNLAHDGYVKLALIVEDNGVGMSPDFLEHIFDPFSREKSATISGVEGTGLGMSIVKKWVDLLDGSIEIKSEKGKGTTVSVCLPLKLLDTGAPSDSSKMTFTKDFTGHRILLVEDNEMNREIACDVLSGFGLTVDTAEDGDVAVEMVSSSEPGTYELILMDIQMPKMNGYDATAAIRELSEKRHSSIPIVAMTANAFEDDKKKSFESGMNAHLTKPINNKELHDTLSRFLNH